MAELASWSDGGPVTVLELDDRDQITAAWPADALLDLPLEPVGRGFDEIVVLISSYYGRRTEIGWVRRRPDLEDRTARYETADGVVDLRSIARLVEPGQVRMAITARRSGLVAAAGGSARPVQVLG
jgi:hypothetical protein